MKKKDELIPPSKKDDTQLNPDDAIDAEFASAASSFAAAEDKKRLKDEYNYALKMVPKLIDVDKKVIESTFAEDKESLVTKFKAIDDAHGKVGDMPMPIRLTLFSSVSAFFAYCAYSWVGVNDSKIRVFNCKEHYRAMKYVHSVTYTTDRLQWR